MSIEKGRGIMVCMVLLGQVKPLKIFLFSVANSVILTHCLDMRVA